MTAPTARRDATAREVEPYILLAAAFVTRLWRIGTPRAVVFDEALYEQYISHYFTHTFYFNLHPPVGKLILAAGAWMLNVAPSVLAEPAPAVALRVVPALAGALIIPLFYLLLRQIGATRRVATLGAAMVLLDNAMLAVSRFILIDSILILFMLGCLTAYLAAVRRSGAARWAFLVLSALLGGFAAGTKWTGLAALGLVGLHLLWRAGRRLEPLRSAAMDALAFATIPGAVYALAFAVHFSLIPRVGPDERLIPEAYRATLIGSPFAKPGATRSFVEKLADTHATMRAENRKYEGDNHPGASPWWSWPVLKHPVYVWNGDSVSVHRSGHILIVGNLAVWWAALVGMLAIGVAACTAAGRRRLGDHRAPLLFLGAGYAINFLPFAPISRILFLYSYLPALLFSIGLAAVGVGALIGWMDDLPGGTWRFGSRRSAITYGAVLFFVVVTFAYYAPVSYGTPLDDAAWNRRLWLLERHVLQDAGQAR